MKNIILLASILGLAACGDNLSGLRPDAREHQDGPPGPDSPPGPDAGIDADTSPDADTGPSTVTVAAGACPGTPDHTLTTMSVGGNPGWKFDADPAASTVVLTIAAGENIEWSTSGSHNFASVLPTGAMSWRSGAIGDSPVCLTFTAAGGPAAFHCEMHPATMTGTLTVTP